MAPVIVDLITVPDTGVQSFTLNSWLMLFFNIETVLAPPTAISGLPSPSRSATFTVFALVVAKSTLGANTIFLLVLKFLNTETLFNLELLTIISGRVSPFKSFRQMALRFDSMGRFIIGAKEIFPALLVFLRMHI